jgi:hypothetical protein
MTAEEMLEALDPNKAIREKNLEKEISQNLEEIPRMLLILTESILSWNDDKIITDFLLAGQELCKKLECRKTACVFSRRITEMFEEMPWIWQAVKDLEATTDDSDADDSAWDEREITI